MSRLKHSLLLLAVRLTHHLHSLLYPWWTFVRVAHSFPELLSSTYPHVWPRLPSIRLHQHWLVEDLSILLLGDSLLVSVLLLTKRCPPLPGELLSFPQSVVLALVYELSLEWVHHLWPAVWSRPPREYVLSPCAGNLARLGEHQTSTRQHYLNRSSRQLNYGPLVMTSLMIHSHLSFLPSLIRPLTSTHSRPSLLHEDEHFPLVVIAPHNYYYSVQDPQRQPRHFLNLHPQRPPHHLLSFPLSVQ